MQPLLEVENLTIQYAARGGIVRAVDGVSFTLARGESLGLVGESGSGKTTVALALLKLLPAGSRIVSGQVRIDGVDLLPLNESRMQAYRWKRIAMVFQAALNTLNPVYRVGDQIIEAMALHLEPMTKEAARARVAELFEMVGLDGTLIDRYPHEFSGGMRQRVVIAMALSCQPDLIIADEPTTALDVIVQRRVLETLAEVRERLGVSLITISHDIGVIGQSSQRVGVMYAGQIVEIGPAAELFERPAHPYTHALMTSLPDIHEARKDLNPLPGEPPDLTAPPPGCRFHPRCSYATDICRREVPTMAVYGEAHRAACWNPLEAVSDEQ